MTKFLVFFLISSIHFTINAQAPQSQLIIEKGYELYSKNEYSKAQVLFEKAVNQALIEKDTAQCLFAYSFIYGVLNTQNNQEYFLKYLQKLQPFFTYKNPFTIGLFNSIGGAYYDAADMTNSEKYYKKAIELSKKLPQNDIELQFQVGATYNLLAELSRKNGDYSRAINSLELSLASYSKIYPKNEFVFEEIHKQELKLAKIFLDRNEYLKSQKYLILAKPITRTNNFSTIVAYYIDMGRLYMKEGLNKPDSAIYYVSLAQNLNKKYKLEATSGQGFDQIGMIQLENNQFSEALKSLNTGLTIRLNQSNKNAAANSYIHLVAAYLKMANYPKALVMCQLALMSSCKENESKKTLSSPNRSQIIFKKEAIEISKQKLFAMNELYKKSNKQFWLDLSLEATKLADELIVDQLNSYNLEASKLYMVEQAQEIYAFGLEAAFEKYILTKNDKYLSQAFYFAEKNKAIVLLNNIRQQNIEYFKGVPNQLIAALKNAQKQVAIAENQLLAISNKDINSKNKWNSKLLLANDLLEKIRNEFERKHNDFYVFHFRTQPISLQNVKNNLKNIEILIEYFTTKNNFYRFSITNNHVNLEKLESNVLVFRQIQEFRKAILNLSPATIFIEKANLLYHSLFQNLVLKNKQKLIIVPDGPLFEMPFEALLAQKPKTLKQEHIYLLESHSFNYSNSASIYFSNQNRNFKKTIYQYTAFSPIYQKPNELPFSKELVRKITRDLNGKLYEGSNATLLNFNKIKSTKILHLAMHGSANIDFSEKSYLAFGVDSLFVYDIYQSQIPAQLAVLDACETGIGQLKQSEGSINLARAFQYAGVQQVAMSLWKLSSTKETTEIVEKFINNSLSGINASEAIQKSKLDYLNKYRKNAVLGHPYYWAPLILIGEAEKKPMEIWPFILIGILGLLVFGFFVKKSKFK